MDCFTTSTSRRAAGRRLAIALAVALAGSGLGAATASAEEDERIGANGGYVHFENDGSDIGREHLWVGDERADGYAMRGYITWRDGAGVHHYSATASGRGDTAHVDLALPEGKAVDIQLCYVKRGDDVRCSGIQRGYA